VSKHSEKTPLAASAPLRSAIEQYLATMQPADRVVLYHRYAERKTVEEIAADLSISEARVQTILTRARALMVKAPRSIPRNNSLNGLTHNI
jgi:RNA polymerase sigma factor (sigma-70 family)